MFRLMKGLDRIELKISKNSYYYFFSRCNDYCLNYRHIDQELLKFVAASS